MKHCAPVEDTLCPVPPLCLGGNLCWQRMERLWSFHLWHCCKQTLPMEVGMTSCLADSLYMLGGTAPEPGLDILSVHPLPARWYPDMKWSSIWSSLPRDWK